MTALTRALMIRQFAAELFLLERFDTMRSCAGHDYGSGQRAAEISRRRRELDELRYFEHGIVHAESTAEPAPTVDELAAAFERVGRARMERAKAPGSIRGWQTKTGRRTIETWQRIERMFSETGLQQSLDSLAGDTAAHGLALVDAPLGPGERVVGGRRLYSSAWLSL